MVPCFVMSCLVHPKYVVPFVNIVADCVVPGNDMVPEAPKSAHVNISGRLFSQDLHGGGRPLKTCSSTHLLCSVEAHCLVSGYRI